MNSFQNHPSAKNFRYFPLIFCPQLLERIKLQCKHSFFIPISTPNVLGMELNAKHSMLSSTLFCNRRPTAVGRRNQNLFCKHNTTTLEEEEVLFPSLTEREKGARNPRNAISLFCLSRVFLPLSFSTTRSVHSHSMSRSDADTLFYLCFMDGCTYVRTRLQKVTTMQRDTSPILHTITVAIVNWRYVTPNANVSMRLSQLLKRAGQF